MWVVLLIGWKFASSNQKHYLELGSDKSSVWNLRDRSSDLIIEGNLWWHHKMLAVFSGFSWKKKKWVPTLHLDGNEAKNPEAIVLQVVSKHYNVDLQWSVF